MKHGKRCGRALSFSRGGRAALGLLLLAGGGAHAWAQADDPCARENCLEVGCGKAARYVHGAGGGVLEAPEPYTPHELALREAMSATDVLNNNLDIEIAPPATTITGSNTMTVMSKVNGLTEFTFNLRSQYVVSSVVLNAGTPQQVTIPGASLVSSGNYLRTVTLDRAYNTGEVFTVKVNYSGSAVSINNSINFTTLNGQTHVYTLSEPYYAGTWWPCKDGDALAQGDNSDKATLTISVTVPQASPQLRVTANGLLTSTTTSGGKVKYTHTTNYPMSTYLVAFAAHPYVTYTQAYTFPGGSMPLEINISPGVDTLANRNAWFLAGQVMETFRPIYGLYPFTNEKYGQYSFGYGGGMEHQTNSGMGGFGESLVVHELAHQWWGDWVTCETWSDIALNEGMATYSEAVWLEKKPGSSGLPALISAMNARTPTDFSGTVYVTNTSSFSAIFNTNNVYRKGAWVFHMLRYVLGDAGFWQYLASMRATFGGGTATFADAQATAEAVYGGSLQWFFDQWVYQPGAAAYAMGWQNTQAGGASGPRFVEVYLTQTQSATYPTYTMPVEIVIDGVTRTVWNTARAQWFLLPVTSAASTVTLDPNSRILATARGSTAFIASPPKVIGATPAPGGAASSPSAPLSVQFSKGVTIPGGAITLTGDTSGLRTVNVAYNAGTFIATITPTAPLPPGWYTLTIGASVVSGGQALDGEVANPLSPGSLPSGDGLAGGAATLRFQVPGAACNLADITGVGGPPAPADGSLTVDDLIEFVNAYSASEGCPGLTPCNASDVTGIGGPPAGPDGQLSVDDLIAFVNAFSEGC